MFLRAALAEPHTLFSYYYSFMSLLLAVGASPLLGFSLVAGSGVYAPAEHGLLTAVASLVEGTGAVVVAHRLSCSTACGIFLMQVSNPCLLPWREDSSPLSCLGSPRPMHLSACVIFII